MHQTRRVGKRKSGGGEGVKMAPGFASGAVLVLVTLEV